MYIARINHLPKYTNLLSSLHSKTFNNLQVKNFHCKNIAFGSRQVVRHYFSSKKQNISKVQKKIQQQKKSVEDLEYLWKLNVFLNLAGIITGFYFPKEALLFVLTSNAIFQVYQSSQSINKIVELCEKSMNSNGQESNESIIEIRKHLKKVAITGVFILASAILTSCGIIYPSIGDYSLIGLNFWMLFNLKFNNFPHGYYIALVSLLLFQYFYYTKTVPSTSKRQSHQII